MGKTQSFFPIGSSILVIWTVFCMHTWTKSSDSSSIENKNTNNTNNFPNIDEYVVDIILTKYANLVWPINFKSRGVYLFGL